MELAVGDEVFGRIQRFLHQRAGISLAPNKKSMVANRLARRVRHHGLPDLHAYVAFATGPEGGDELRVMLDLLTTNETSFFREPAHFDFLRQHILPHAPKGRPFRVWSAASSSGEEPYTLGMVLDEALGAGRWEVLGTDISTRVLEVARSGRYPIEHAQRIPRHYLHAYALRGVRSQEGFMQVSPRLRAATRFEHFNLNGDWGDFSERFDVIFLRNVMIYFDPPTKRRLVLRMLDHLQPGGHLIIGHSETLNGITDRLQVVRPSIYRLTDGAPLRRR
jgi:chemotaxis protein methyltransferase CheR